MGLGQQYQNAWYGLTLRLEVPAALAFAMRAKMTSSHEPKSADFTRGCYNSDYGAVRSQRVLPRDVGATAALEGPTKEMRKAQCQKARHALTLQPKVPTEELGEK